MFQFGSREAFIVSCLLTVINLCSNTVLCEEIPVLSDKSVISISLKNYNVSDPDGESIEGKYILMPDTNSQIRITSIPPDIYFVVLQVHSYFKNITLSYNPEPTRQTSISGMNIGLVKMNDSPVLYYHLLYDNPVDNGTVLIAVQAYGRNAPIPGGCNMEFQVETSPFLRTTLYDFTTEVDFAPALPSLPLLLDLTRNMNTCNVAPDPVNYKMYRMYLPEGDFSEDLYFDSLKMMMTKSRILTNGRLTPDKTGVPPMRHLFVSYPGTGRVFVVVAETKDGSSVYVPLLTYSCHIEGNNNCGQSTTTLSKLLSAAIFLRGLFSCLTGHGFFKTELGIIGILSGLIFYRIAVIDSNVSATDWSSSVAGIGLACGICLLLIWFINKFSLLRNLVSNCILGCLISSCLFYNLTDLYDPLQRDINYYFIFFSVVLLVPIFMISLAEKGNSICCSIVGAYLSVLSIDYFIGSNWKYIIINPVRRATVPRFEKAVVDPPFQTEEIVLTSVWLLLAVCGVTIQLAFTKDRSPYSALSGLLKRSPSTLSTNNPPNERTSLLRSV